MFPQSSTIDFDALNTQAERYTIRVLLSLFAALVLLLGLLFGAAVLFTTIAFATMRLGVAFLRYYIGLFQTKQAAAQHQARVYVYAVAGV